MQKIFQEEPTIEEENENFSTITPETEKILQDENYLTEAILEFNQQSMEDDGWDEEMEKRYWEEQPPYPFATDIELEAINESNKVKYTDNDILYVLDGLVEPAKMDIIRGKLNEVWNNKNGVF